MKNKEDLKKNNSQKPNLKDKIPNYLTIVNKMVFIGIGFGIFFWFLEAFLHVFVFHEGNLTQQILHPALHETWMRLVAISVIVMFGIYAQSANNRLTREEGKVKYAYAELNQIFHIAADGMRVIDKDFNILRINKTLINLLDIREDEAINKKCYETFYGPPCHTTNCPMTQILSGKNRVEAEVNKERQDGVKIPCIVTAIPFRGTDGEIIGIVEDFKDITERKQFEETLRESEWKLAAMLDSIGDHMSMMDKDLNILWANKVAKNLFGEDIVGKKCYQVYHQREKPCEPSPCLALKSFEDGGVHEHETEVIAKDGEKIYFHCTAHVALKNNKEKPIAVLEISRNITESKRFEDALRESEDKYRTITSTAKDAIMMMDNQGNIAYWNPAAEKIFGYTEEEAIGKELHIFLSPQRYHRDYRKGFSKFKETGQGPVVGKTLELSAIKKDGTEFPLELSLSAIKIGGKWHATGIIRDVTERKQAEKMLKTVKDELEKQNVELKKIDKIKDSLVRDVTHELKTPVAKHSMQLEILKEILQTHKLTDKTQNVVKIMDASIKRQENVIRNILDLSRLEAGGRKYKTETVSIDKIIEELIEDFRYALEAYEIQIKMDLEAMTIKSDGEMLAHVFSNLINNAIKYRKKHIKAKIDILCEKKEKEVIIKIIDNGIGLAKEEKEKVFDRFYQASPSAEGSGVGLTISKMITEGLGGKIWLESEGKGRGTTIVMQLPMQHTDKIERRSEK